MLGVVTEKIARQKSPQVNISFDNNIITISFHRVRNADPPTPRCKPREVELVYITNESQHIYATKKVYPHNNQFFIKLISIFTL